MANEHVYLYYRFAGWVAEQRECHWWAFLLRDFARQERVLQQHTEIAHGAPLEH